MKRRMCKSRIRRATVTDADLNYEGSLTIDNGGQMVVNGAAASSMCRTK